MTIQIAGIPQTPAASQAQMEAGSILTAMVTPGRAQYHPGAAKAWGRFNGTGTPAYAASHNLDASITDNGVGDYTLSFTTDFSSANYSMLGASIMEVDGQPVSVFVKFGSTPAAGSIRIQTGYGTFVYVDVTMVFVAFFGDQA